MEQIISGDYDNLQFRTQVEEQLSKSSQKRECDTIQL